MSKWGYLAGVAVGIPLVLTALIKLLGAVQSLFSKLAVFLLWLVSMAGGVFSLLYFWERQKEKRRYATPGEGE